MREEIIEIVRSYCALEEDIGPESELKLLSLDSLSFVAVLVKLEEIFDIEFEIEELTLERWETLEDLIKAVERKRNDEK